MMVFIARIVEIWVDSGIDVAACFHGGVVARSVNCAFAARTAFESTLVAESLSMEKTFVPDSMLSPATLFDKD
jgi:hypothetical protein